MSNKTRKIKQGDPVGFTGYTINDRSQMVVESIVVNGGELKYAADGTLEIKDLKTGKVNSLIQIDRDTEASKEKVFGDTIHEDSTNPFHNFDNHTILAPHYNDGRMQHHVAIDIYTDSNRQTLAYRAKSPTGMENVRVLIYSLINTDPTGTEIENEYKSIGNNWWITPSHIWHSDRTKNDVINERIKKQDSEYISPYDLIPDANGYIELDVDVSFEEGKYYRVLICADNQFELLGSTNEIVDFTKPITDPQNLPKQDFPYVERTYRDITYVDISENTLVTNDGLGIDLLGESVCFSLDTRNITVLMSNGHWFNVNTARAEANDDGTIHIYSIDPNGSIQYFYNLEIGNVCTDNGVIAGGLSDIANVLNTMFTGGAFEFVVISDPHSTIVADVGGVNTTGGLVGNAIDPSGTDIGAGIQSHYNKAGYLSTETIDQAGEYFTFNMRNEGIFGACLVLDDIADAQGNLTYADPTRFCDGITNSGNSGIQWGMFFHPSPNGPWTYYGASTGTVLGSGWNGSDAFRYSNDGANWLAGNAEEFRIGIDSNSFISMEYYDNDTSTWIVVARTSYPVGQGVKFHLGIKFCDAIVRLTDIPKIHLLEPAVPTMYFRYAESPDGVYPHPVFATSEEANYFDLQNGGSGTSHNHIFPDDPTQTSWFMPDNGADSSNVAPSNSETFMGNPINWTEITTVTDADLAPTAFSDTTYIVSELSSVNIPLVPAGATGYSTTIIDTNNIGLNLDSTSHNLIGISPEVTSDNVTNPSDDYLVTVIRTRTSAPYVSSQGVLTIQVNNLTPPATAISGFTHEATSTPMVDSDTLGDGSVVVLDDTLAVGKRFIIEKSYVEDNILPSLQASGDKYIIGVANGSADFSTLEDTDFDFAIQWEYNATNSHRVRFLRDGGTINEVVVGSVTDAVYSYAFDIKTTDACILSDTLSNLNTEPAYSDGGIFQRYSEVAAYDGTAPLSLYMASVGTNADISTNGISTIDTPIVASGGAVFDASITPHYKGVSIATGQYLKQKVNTNDANPMRRFNSGTEDVVTAGETATNGQPWAVGVIFRAAYNGGIFDQSSSCSLGISQGKLVFNYGTTSNRLYFTATNTLVSGVWYGLYMDYNGGTTGAGSGSVNDYYSRFRLKLVNFTTGAVSDVAVTWGNSNYGYANALGGSFRMGIATYAYLDGGIISSAVVTTLNNGVALPDDTEINMMTFFPKQWKATYKDGNSFRYPSAATTNQTNFGSGGSSADATKIWLMFDNSLDSYDTIRNVVGQNQDNSKLKMYGMTAANEVDVTVT